MGHMRHHAILVTSYNYERAIKANEEAWRIFGKSNPDDPIAFKGSLISPLTGSMMNGYWSFAVFPDGSKEWWGTSDWMNDLRAEFIEWLRRQYHEDGGSDYDWVEVQYGDDGRETKIVKSSDDDAKSDDWNQEAVTMQPCSEGR